MTPLLWLPLTAAGAAPPAPPPCKEVVRVHEGTSTTAWVHPETGKAEGCLAPALPQAAAAPAGPDRSQPPAVADPPVLPLAEPERHELAPGVVAHFVRVPGVRKVALELRLQAGAVELDGRSNAVAEAAAWLADAAAADLGAAAMQELEDLKEIDVSTWGGPHAAGVSLTVPAEELPAGLELLGKVLREPTFPKTEVNRWKLDRKLWLTVEGPASQDALARAALAFGWFPADHPYGVRPDLSQLGQVDAAALAARWRRATHEAPISIVVVGDVEWSALEPSLTAMVQGLGREGARPPELSVEGPGRLRAVVVDLPGQAQVAVRARWLAPAFRAEDGAAMNVANFFLGGAFLSRLNTNLREEKGFTYGARTRYAAAEKYGTFSVQVDVKAENLGETVSEIRKELHRIATEPGTDNELVSARRGFAADWNRTLQTADDALGVYSDARYWGLSMAEWRGWTEQIQSVTLDQVQAASARWLADDRPALWVFVGDAAAIREQLASTGWTLEVVSPSDATLGRF